MTLWLVASVWCLLALGGALGPRLGAEEALLASYLACTALVLGARPRPLSRRVPLGRVALAGAAGFVALPAWLALVAGIGGVLGLALASPGRIEPGLAGWLAHGALAPVFEELVYRERLLPALRARFGAPLALVLSSAAFAAPHLEPWSVLTTFLVGLVLGRLLLSTGSVALCVAHHAGLNAAALACGVPPVRWALPPLAAALAAAGLLVLARGRASVGACPRVHAAAR